MRIPSLLVVLGATLVVTAVGPEEEARGWLETTSSRGSPDPKTRYCLLWSLSLITGMQGDVIAARTYSEEALAICEGRSDILETSRIIANLGLYERLAGKADRGVRLVGAREVSCERFSFDMPTAAASGGDVVESTLEQGTRAVGPRAASLRVGGRRMSLEDAVAFAREDPQARPSDVRISPREVEVARVVRHGYTDPQIAKRLFISKRTAEGHVESLRNKLGVGSRAEVAAWVAENLPTEQPAAERR